MAQASQRHARESPIDGPPEVRALGGEVRTGSFVRSLDELPAARAVLLDVSARGLLEIAGGRLPTAYAGWLQRFRYGSAACKVDFALSGPVPAFRSGPVGGRCRGNGA